MRFLLRSAFWLGLVFHAMPLGGARPSDAVPNPRDAVAGLPTPGRDGAAASAIAGAAVRAPFGPRSAADKTASRAAPAAKPARSSVDTLSAADRLPSWRGSGPRSTT